MKFTLITGRTFMQGVGMEVGKDSDLYKENTAVCYITVEDMSKLGIKEGDNVKIKTKYGEVVVKALKSKDEHEGIVFIPLGPWANAVMSYETDSVAVPTFKGVEAEIEKTDEEVLSLEELIKKIYIEG